MDPRVRPNRPLFAFGLPLLGEIEPLGTSSRPLETEVVAVAHLFRALRISTAAGIDPPQSSVDFSGLFDV